MSHRIRTLDFLPDIFKTSTNAQFLGATLDQLVNPPKNQTLQGYVGSKFGYGINAKDYYVTEPTKTRTDYQLAPGVVFLKENQNTAQDFITYPGIIDALKLKGGVTTDNSKLFTSQFYSWDSFSNLDKLINYNQYYWLPDGPPAVTVASATVFNETDYVVTDTANAYNIRALGAASGSLNPTITLLRGGTYRFAVNQETQFWIQGVPGVTGLDGNKNTRDILGVSNNGANQGFVTFTVPNRNAQDDFIFPGNNTVDLISTKLFSEINGKTLSELGNIDGVTSLEGLTVMFYNTADANEIGFVSAYYDEADYDENLETPVIVAPVTLSINQTTTSTLVLASGDTSALVENQTVTFTQPDGLPLLGGLDVDTIYYVKDIISPTTFTISDTVAGSTKVLTADTGTMVANVNEGLFEEGFYTVVNENFYSISYVGDSADPTIRLLPAGNIPTEEKITVVYGSQFVGLEFYRNTLGQILEIPYLSSLLDTLYYQDGTNPNKVGVIRLIESNLTNTLNVEEDILGKQNFTSTNGVEFTNGLKVQFDGDVVPSSYLEGEYYVEGVGTSIELIPARDLVCPEDFTGSTYIPYDSLPYDIGRFDQELFIPVEPDYITIARNSINNNAWSRSNRWFHIDVINATAQYNEDPTITTTYATGRNKAKRPIIEFYPNLKLFDSGSAAKAPVDFIDTRTTNAFTRVANQQQYYPDIETYTTYTGVIASASSATTTTITIPTSGIFTTFQVGMYITDSTNVLPRNTQIDSIDVSGTNTILTVSWQDPATFSATTNSSIVGSDTTVNNYALFQGARIVFTQDTNPDVRNKIWVVGFSSFTFGSTPIITLTPAEDALVEENDQTVALRGYNYQGSTFWFDGTVWNEGQQKLTVNQAPLFDVFDENGISFGDAEYYAGTSFTGNKLFAYGIGSGTNDPILGFPVRYSNIDNVGDLSFDVSLNKDTFSYVTGTDPITQNVNTGYVYNYSDRTEFTRELGWQTAVAPSVQYQVFELEYQEATVPQFTCDVAVIPESESASWPRIQVYVNNQFVLPSQYTVTSTANSTVVTLSDEASPVGDQPIQILLLSNQVSKTAYYDIPINLNNNPFNEDLTQVNIGDIRSQYQNIFVNTPDITGTIFGSNNFRDLGNLVPYGTKIIQNSASLVLPGVFLRKSEHNIFDALQYNSHQYVQFKQILVNTVNNIDWEQRFSASYILDKALEQISANKTEGESFFWSDMLPSQAPYRSNSYTFANALQESVYPLTQIYNFDTANYTGVLVYLTRVVAGVQVTTQLVKDRDYVVSTTSPSLSVTVGLQPNDIITIKEYNQTYGSYVPNTPTKLGMYPSFVPEVVLDPNYSTPTYMLRGHDGSYTSLYGDYSPEYGLIDFRDQALLEFETRIYNNLKLSTEVPINAYEVLPGFFREGTYSNEDYLRIYSPYFLNWAGQNRINYKTQQGYTSTNEFVYNYTGSGNKLTNTPIYQGYWRGISEFFYGSLQPNIAPWEMLGFAEEPSWWQDRYGPAPYTSTNDILWGDIEAGIIWNNGDPITVDLLKRPGLSKILPVDAQGNLKSPLQAIVGQYTSNTFKREWKVGDIAPAELAYRRSSSYPFDLMKIFALTRPAEFFNLSVDLDNYKYNTEFNQYLVNNRSHLIINDIEVYGNGTAKTSYLNWIVDFEKQQGVDATTSITGLLDNLDVRLIYRLAGYSDKTFLKFFVEKGTPNSNNASLLIPDESYALLLHDNQPMDTIKFSAVVLQLTADGWRVYGNSQSQAYFTVDTPINNGVNTTITVDDASVKLPLNYTSTETEERLIPYGTQFYSTLEVATFLMGYGHWLERKGMVFDNIEYGMEINWEVMVKEFLFWAQTGWENGAILTLNPAAQNLKVFKESEIVQPLTIQQNNFILNQNLYPIALGDLAISRLDTEFNVKTLNSGDTMAYTQFNLSNFEHGVVFDNTTLFNDIIYNLITGLRQNRIFLRGTKTAEWNGTVFASGFILNQDNIQEWNVGTKYTKGMIVTYKNKYWTAIKVIEPSATFRELDWVVTDYDEIQKGLLPNSSTRCYEQTLYYNDNVANLEKDADQLSFSLIGYRPRDYLALVDLTDITQVNVYKNMIKNKGTPNAVSAFKGANLPQGGIDYDVYENWAILSGQFGGTLNGNFVDFRINEALLTGNPAIVSLTNGTPTPGAQQEVPTYGLFNYARPISDPNVLMTTDSEPTTKLYPTAGYVNYDDVKMASYFYSGLVNAINNNAIRIPISAFYVRDYVWLANFKERWRVYTWKPVARVIGATPSGSETVITFDKPHGLKKLDPISLIQVDNEINGYYVVTRVNSITEVSINITTERTFSLDGSGLGLTFIDQRVAKPSEIETLDLNEAEFVKNTVWVDEGSNGGWTVYRKSINYQQLKELDRVDGQSFGSAVAYTDRMGYLIGDADAGKVYRYGFNPVTQNYEEDTGSLLTSGPSFGSKIAYSGNLFVISEPTGTPKLHIYTLNDTILTDDIIDYQPAISVASGVGTDIAISKDQNWIYASDPANVRVLAYRRERIPLNAGYFVTGQTYQITEVGTTDFKLIGAVDNKVGIIFVATGPGTGTGSADQITYNTTPYVIDGSADGAILADNFGFSVSTDYNGDTIAIGAPNFTGPGGLTNYGKGWIYSRLVQNVEVQYTSIPDLYQPLELAFTPTATTSNATAVSSNYITVASTTGMNVNDPVVFDGSDFGDSGISPYQVYYIEDIVGSTFSLKLSRSSTTVLALTDDPSITITAYVQSEPLLVSVNGTPVDDDNYAYVGSQLRYYTTVRAGDIVTISSNEFQLLQTVVSNSTDRVGVQLGYDNDMISSANEILFGAPGEIVVDGNFQEDGAVYRFTNGGAKYGTIIGANECLLTANRKLLINGFLVPLANGSNAATVASQINGIGITNVQATATDNKLIISVIDKNLSLVNERLLLQSPETATFTDLGIEVYTNTQVLTAPHAQTRTLFGNTIKFNEFDSVVISAPAGTRFAGTTFDFTDDENLDNDTVFDQNATRFVDQYPNAGAVYMYDYLANYNGSIADPGKFIYAQSCNSLDNNYGFQPMYGTALDFRNNQVVIGTPDLSFADVAGQINVYRNQTGVKDWAVYRESAPVVDIEKIQNSQIYSAETNQTLINLDYLDPMQNKMLGVIRQNIDYVDNIDPARYNADRNRTVSGKVWGSRNEGRLWFDTSNVRWLNYHQNDVVYNSKFWGRVFPGSDVAVYTWVTSNVPPGQYAGPGTVRSTTQFSVESTLNASNVSVPLYSFWVRNTDTINTKIGKTISDINLQIYIRNPRQSGIAYFAPLLPNTFALYNAGSYINANDSVFHVGFGTGQSDDVPHQEFSLIRTDYPDDFLPGLPKLGPQTQNNRPEGLYDRMLDSLAGVDEAGAVVPNPFLPKAVQSGVLARPRQSFFFDRLTGLKNFLQYANDILAQFPIAETRREATYLFATGEFYNTPDYWEYVNWWLPTNNPENQYNNNTKASLNVPVYADLAKLNVALNTLVKVTENGDGKWEMYRFDGAGVWTRVGLENGTIKFKTYLWDYAEGKIGFGDNFFDTSPFDEYPSEETRWIIRALNEQIYIDELVEYRNKSLIILFQYIESETDESQNYLPWLNKTSLIDVAHTIRELLPIENFQSDNQDFLEGYLNEVKPYHVVIKDFLFKYTGSDVYTGDVTDFDLPAQYNTAIQQYVTPELVYTGVDTTSEFSVTSPIWSTPDYSNWFNNYGVTITGQDNYQITTLASYITIGSTFLIVDNAQGFPINGTITIGDEQISYAFVDRALNVLGGLQRGINGTTPVTHIPGDDIYIDLPAVLLLDGGTGYTEPPKVTAYIDTFIYPEPRVEAQLEAVMSVDSVVSVRVIDPGEGYAVLPEIIIDPAQQIFFTNAEINSTLHTIKLFAPNLATGDIVRYQSDPTGATINRLVDGNWYYVNVLETVPTSIIALYPSYRDAVRQVNRIEFTAGTTDGNFVLNVGARATAISSSYPVRENNTTIRFDRTTFNSQVTDWEAGVFYGSFFAGSYFNSEKVASSSIGLESTQPPIDSILASAQGVVFEISQVENDHQVTWSSFVRRVSETVAANDVVRLNPYDESTGELNSSGSTIGFYVGMPIKFTGAVIGGIVADQVYYVDSIVNITDFTISETAGGSTFALSNATATSAGMSCLVGEVVDTAVLTLNYPGIITATATTKDINTVTIPQSVIGTGGTDGFYIGIPLFFTGDVFGGIIENDVYYVTTVVDSENVTISAEPDPLTATVSATTSGTNIVTVDDTTGFSVNDPIIFNTMVDGSSNPINSYGGIDSGALYYVNEIVSLTELKISTQVNNVPVTLTDVTTGSALLTNQKDTLDLTNATGTMTMNVSLPVSPGQINGQLFSLYDTSAFYTDINSGVLTDALVRTAYATIAGDAIEGTDNRIALSMQDKGTYNFYVNMPVVFNTTQGGITSGTVYYVTEFSDPDDQSTFIEVDCSGTSSSTNRITCLDTSSLWVNMPIIFSGVGLGGIVIGTEYYIKTIDSATQFTITDVAGGSVVSLTTDNGPMTGTGNPFIKVSTTPGGSAVTLTDTNTAMTMTQTPQTTAEFDIGFILGGYRAVISNAGSGYAVTNTITISGNEVGGTSPANDVTLVVNTIDSNGAITSLIIEGDPEDTVYQYYFKVRTPDTVEVYSDPRMTVPVSGIDFPFNGFTTANVTDCTSGTDTITLDSVAGFNDNDAIVFMGTLPNNSIDVEIGETYYIIDIDTITNEIQVSDTPNGSAVNVVTTLALTNLTISKAGSFAFLPEPFYFTQSIVKYLNRVYRCIISNNDTEFVLGKWEELDSGDRVLNALDRVEGYYQPTANMPGFDLTQLFEGIIYPNSVYYGNAFAPEDQFTLDTELQDQPFYPTGVSITSILWNDQYFLSPANLENYSGVIRSATGQSWSINKVSNAPINVTDIVEGNGLYVMTSTNTATPVFRSNDGVTWTTNGWFTPYDALPYDTNPYDSTALSIAAISLRSVDYGNGFFVAAGRGIVQSSDTYVWTERKAYDPVFDVTLYGVKYCVTSGYTGFVAVGKGKRYEYSSGVTELVDTNIVAYSFDDEGQFWQDGPSATPLGFYGIESDGTYMLAVGEDGIIYQSNNGGNWVGLREVGCVSVNEPLDILNVISTEGFASGASVSVTDSFAGLTAGDTYYVDVISSTQVKLYTDAGLSSLVTLTADTIPLQARLYHKDPTLQHTLLDIKYANSIWMAVGEDGQIQTSSDRVNWTQQTSGTVKTLRGITFNQDESLWVVVGDDNTIIQSDDDGITWTSSSFFTVQQPIYDVQGAEFPYGYGPEELVPGLIKDNLTMTVTTRPGTNWDVTQYSHTGYNVASVVLYPQEEFQTVYSFEEILQHPAQISLQVIDPATELGTGLATSEYTVDWPNKIITLDSPLQFSPMQALRIDVYEVGNGNQLVKACSDTYPIREMEETGFDDIYLNCNYSASIFQGSGVIRTGSHSIEVEAIATDANGDTITFVDVSNFVANDPITFQGVVFGGIADETTYYVKTISTATNSITVSETYNTLTGLAGPTKALTTATGSMICNIQTGTGTVWTDPVVNHNGQRLVLGKTNTISRTKASNNAITTGTTAGLIVGSRIIFAANMFGSDITPNQYYYINSIVDGNEFTISETLGGPTLTLSDASGISSYVTNDYAIGIQPNGQQAKLVLAAPGSYNNEDDYFVFSLFGETAGTQYGYTLPEIAEFTGDGSTSSFTLPNFCGDDNPTHAIVEIDGLRQTISRYTINSGSNTILFNSPPANGAKISVLTYNNTERQYFTSQYGISGISGGAFTAITVTDTVHSEVPYDAGDYDATSAETPYTSETVVAGSFVPDVVYQISDLGTTTDWNVVAGTSGITYNVGDIFTAVDAGSGDGEADTVISALDELYDYLVCTDTSTLVVDEPIVFSSPALGGLTGGFTYYVLQIINSTVFTISTTPGGTPVTVTDDTGSMTGTSNAITVAPISNILTEINNPLAETRATATSSTGNEITFNSTTGFIVDQTVILKGTGFGNLVPGTVYFVESVIDSTTATLKDATGTQVTVTNASGNLITIVGGNDTARITTSVPHAYADDQLAAIDGCVGASELNGNNYYVKVIDQYRFDIYTQPWDPAVSAVNYPVVGVTEWVSGGYTWRQGTFFITTTTASATATSTNYITVNSTADLVANTPVIFTQQGQEAGATLLGGIEQGVTYYVKQVISNTEFTIGLTRDATTAVSLTNDSGIMNVTQWEQTNVERLWVTVNGYRVPNSKLRMREDNEVSILTEVVPGDVVIITSMIPHSTPDEEIYLDIVNTAGEESIYRADVHQSRTWLTQPIYDLSTSVYVYDVNQITDQVVQNLTAPSPVNNIYSIGLTADKRLLTGVKVVNNTLGVTLDPDTYEVVIEELSPILKITNNSDINSGDSLTITSLVGNIIYVNGEQIRFTTVEFNTNSVTGLQRGANGTAQQDYIPVYTPVLSLLSSNKLPEVYYDQTWNSYVYNTVDGDPLQISETDAAQFLHTDIT